MSSSSKTIGIAVIALIVVGAVVVFVVLPGMKDKPSSSDEGPSDSGESDVSPPRGEEEEEEPTPP